MSIAHDTTIETATHQQAYVPLHFEPGERGEFDFGHAVIVEAGRQIERPFRIGRLRYSGMPFLVCLPTERQEYFLFGQRLDFDDLVGGR